MEGGTFTKKRKLNGSLSDEEQLSAFVTNASFAHIHDCAGKDQQDAGFTSIQSVEKRIVISQRATSDEVEVGNLADHSHGNAISISKNTRQLISYSGCLQRSWRRQPQFNAGSVDSCRAYSGIRFSQSRTRKDLSSHQ